MKLKIGNFDLNKDGVYIIAELSANHNGSLQIALDSIKEAKRCGANAVKLQTYTPDTITLDCQNDDFSIKGDTLWDGQNLYQLYQKAYTPWQWHKELFEYAKTIGIDIFSSPFDISAVDFLEQFDPIAYKIASFEITDYNLIKYVASKQKPIIISTGVAHFQEIKDVINICKSVGNHKIILLKCTSSYPTPLKKANLNTIPAMIDEFKTVVGFSDHTIGSTAPIVAVSLGAKVIEKHFIINKDISSEDKDFSMVAKDFKKMVKKIRNTQKLLGKVDFDMDKAKKTNRRYCRSIYVSKDIKKGDVLSLENLKSVRPGFGMHPKYLNEVLGTLATKDYKFGDRFQRQEKQCKTLTVITEGGKEFGFGHITRCLSISRAFEKYSFKTVFIIDADDSVDSMLKKTKYYSFNWQKEFNKLKSKIKDSTYILIDSMQISDKDILNIQQINKNIIFIDDEKRRNILDFGFVVDWTVLSDEKNYFKQRKQNVTYILGSKFTPLREEFLNTKKNTINKELKSIMITLGGSDVRDLTPDILKILMIMFSKLEKNVVIGAGFTNVDIIKKYQDKNTNLIYNASAKQMAKLMQTSDLAIASGGQTLYELALIGTPCIAILLVDNAKDDTIGWDKVGAVKNIGWWDDDDMLDDLVYAISELKSQEKRQQMQDNGKKYINNNGAKLLVDKILGL